jgi:hypothetical protein
MVYLLHFESPIAPGKHTTQHYIGYAADVEARVAEHAAGHGARLTQVAVERGIAFEVVRVWEGGRAEERRLKNIHGMRLCPVCHPENKRGNNGSFA